MRQVSIMQNTRQHIAVINGSSARVIRSGVIFLSLLSTLALGGCIAVGGTSHAAPRPTLGQELVDLKRAVDSGAITSEEYASLRSRAMSGSAHGGTQVSADKPACDS
jgi:hypothetical protein